MNQVSVPSPMALVGFPGSRNEHWYSVGSPPASIRQGWKLYISATPTNYIDMLHEVAQILVSEGIAFKYLRSLSKLMETNAGLHGFSQIGKCVVAYLHDPSVIPAFVRRLYAALDRLCHEGPFVPRLPQAWNGGCVYYRYGSFTATSIRMDNEWVIDDRNRPGHVLSSIPFDPFVETFGLGRMQDIDKVSSILTRYPVMEVLCRSGKGGVFHAFDANSDLQTELIAKIGLRRGQSLPDGRDGAYFLRHERSMYEVMSSMGLAEYLPKVIDFSSEYDANVMILERIQGENLAEWRRCGGSDPQWLEMALRMIREIHERGFLLGDAKTANFIKCDFRLVLVDLESCRLLRDGDVVDYPATFNILGVKSLSLYDIDLIHFLVSAIYAGDDMAFSLGRARSIDVQQVLADFVPKDQWDISALDELTRIMRGTHESGGTDGGG